MWRKVKVAVMALVCSAGLVRSAGMTFAAAPGASESTEDFDQVHARGVAALP